MKKTLFVVLILMSLTACQREGGKKTAELPAEGQRMVEEKPEPQAVKAQQVDLPHAQVQQVEPASACEDEDCAMVERMRAALHNDDRQALSQMFYYPLRQRVPVPTLKNGDDFLKHYDEIFDETLIAILRDKGYESWEEMGWRGKTIENGVAWINAGKITALNYCGPACQKERDLTHDLNHPGLIAALYPVEEEQANSIYYLYATPERKYLLMAFKEGHGAEEAANTLYLTSSEAPKEAAMGGLSYHFEAEVFEYALTILPEGGQLSVHKGGKVSESIALEHSEAPLSPPEF